MSTSPELEACWQRVAGLAAKLAEAVDTLEEAGGLVRLAPTWKPKTLDKARRTLLEARQALDGPLAELKSRRPVAPIRRPSERHP